MKPESYDLKLEVVQAPDLSPDKRAALVSLCIRAYR